MEITLALWLMAAACAGIMVSLNVSIFCIWRYIYWSERLRELREQLRGHGLSGHETLKRA